MRLALALLPLAATPAVAQDCTGCPSGGLFHPCPLDERPLTGFYTDQESYEPGDTIAIQTTTNRVIPRVVVTQPNHPPWLSYRHG